MRKYPALGAEAWGHTDVAGTAAKHADVAQW